ncbi:MAP kinase kinase Wis1 [Saxophila tyrrhenica]|uniref:mitogen-activated protein kinase kinase n=1 Tax=Saxophila tyrrhenica TaxID=1690608 RepID=A0AAV9NUX3_9PEZI|nr:MAP kinase kinase Wis1 [Saxophila tyrrhenica]
MASSPTPDSEPESPFESPSDLTTPLSEVSTPDSDSAPSPPPLSPPPLVHSQTSPASPPTARSNSSVGAATTANMNPSSTPLGTLNAARGKPPTTSASSIAGRGGAAANPDIMAKMKAFSLSRSGQPPPATSRTPGPSVAASPGPAQTGGNMGGFPAGFKLPPHMQRPMMPSTTNSSPAVTGPGAAGAAGAGGAAKPMSMAERRGMKLPGGLPGASNAAAPAPAAGGGRRKPPGMTLSQMGAGQAQTNGDGEQQNGDERKQQSQMDKYAQFIDTKTGALKFKGKATIDGSGVVFASGRSFSISLDEVDTLDELGKGNYGTVYKVRHSRPKFRRTGQGLAGNKSRGPNASDESDSPSSPRSATAGGTTGVVMAMKEMRLELEDAKFATIIMELDVLHRCMSPYIVDFYGAFFQEGSVYICMEFMDGGSVDRLYGDGVPEGVLRKITLNTVLGLKSLKEEHNIIHRDVKPTNILVNTRGQVKICDFGVSGNLVASMARTNIGCQSYMAPERISSGGTAQPGSAAGTYSVQSDIWSLGLTIIECAMGRYPYPPETYDNIFSQLSAIVDGEPPDLPADSFSDISRDFVAGCLNKIPKLRPTYPMLLQHAWLAPLAKPQTIMEEDEEAAEAEGAVGGEAPAAAADDEAAEKKEDWVDQEVGEWVIGALDRRKRGVMGKAPKPALHAAPLDKVGGPGSPGGMDGAGEKVAAVAVDA